MQEIAGSRIQMEVRVWGLHGISEGRRHGWEVYTTEHHITSVMRWAVVAQEQTSSTSRVKAHDRSPVFTTTHEPGDRKKIPKWRLTEAKKATTSHVLSPAPNIRTRAMAVSHTLPEI